MPKEQKQPSLEELLELARAYGVEDNELFRSACCRYAAQVEMIDRMRKEIDAQGFLVEHVNVRGTKNLEPHPLAVQLPKYIDSANRTMALMLDLIRHLGTKPATQGNRLQEIMRETGD